MARFYLVVLPSHGALDSFDVQLRLVHQYFGEPKLALRC
jgi:hypothetical protein